MFKWCLCFIPLLLDSEAQENWKGLSSSYSDSILCKLTADASFLHDTLSVVLQWYVCNVLIKRYCSRPTMCQKSIVQQVSEACHFFEILLINSEGRKIWPYPEFMQ